MFINDDVWGMPRLGEHSSFHLVLFPAVLGKSPCATLPVNPRLILNQALSNPFANAIPLEEMPLPRARSKHLNDFNFG